MDKFESVLLDYGMHIFALVFQAALKNERYEDCALMREIGRHYDIDLDASEEDWQTEFWRRGYSGETAIAHKNEYLLSAFKMVGYEADFQAFLYQKMVEFGLM